MTGGRRSHDKGNRAERAIVRFFQDRGFAAERVPLSGSAGGPYKGDLTVPIAGRDLVAEVKVRANGFAQLYAWLEGRDLLIVKSDRRDPLVILPLRLAAEIAAVAEWAKAIPDTNLAAICDASRARPVLARVQTSRTEMQHKEKMSCQR
jgi:Holliday junction resolvase